MPRPEMAKQLNAFQRDFKDQALPGYVIYSSSLALPLGQGVMALPVGNL